MLGFSKRGLTKWLGNNKGYTIDQTILIVAIIAILITLVIVTVGWQLINRSSGTKLGAQLRQIEDANGQFYSGQHVWPNQALVTASANATNNVTALANGLATSAFASNINTSDLRNLLPGYKVSGGAVQHGFGAGGAVTQDDNVFSNTAMSGTNHYLVVQFASVPRSEAEEADKAIDGVLGYNVGRVVYQSTGNCLAAAGGTTTMPTGGQPSSATVTLCYAANVIQ